MRGISLLSCILVSIPGIARADFARPEEHGGLRDIVLIYRGAAPRTAKEMLPLVAHVDRSGVPRAWFFDGFLLLTQQPEWCQSETRAQMQGWLDALFAPGGLVPELQAAVQAAEQRLGAPPTPRQVMISLPRPVGGEGLREARLPDLEWFIDETVRRWQAAAPRHLALWGTYWYWEEIGAAEGPLVRGACDATHRHGLKTLWIPWFRASGWDQWREAGFDLAILQPNYAFLPPAAGRHLPDESRLSETARLAREAGMGVEIETRYALTASATDRANLRLYLNHALSDGYAGAVRAHFHSMDQYQRLAASTLPEARQLYDDLYALCAGRLQARPVSLLHQVPVRRLRAGGARAETVALTGPRPEPVVLGAGDRLELRLDPPRLLDELRLCLAGDGQSTGLRALTLSGRAAAGGPWRVLDSLAEAPPPEGGWLLSTWQPVRLSALRVSVEPFPGRRVTVTGLTAYPAEPASSSPDNLALGCRYVVRPGHRAVYPDRGGELTDGLLSEEGFADGRTVGWSGVAKVVVEITLPEAVPVEAVRCHLQGGGYAAVQYPRALSVAVSDDGERWRLLSDAPPRTEPLSARAGATEGLSLAWLRQEGPPGGERARHVRVTLVPAGWLMLSEVEVWSGGRNVALKAPYRFRPLPHAAQSYSDDGEKLTNGTAVPSFEHTVGWDQGPAEVEVDLGRACRVRAARAYVLGGGNGGVYLPREVTLSLSADGQAWTAPVPLRLPRRDEQEASFGVWASANVAPQPARYARLRLTPARGWLMLGEVEVLGTAE